ncbi:hypothetical protein HAHE_37540 [Haloferula helveola]|uniref:Uncharacterized protein n=2 Tax=Haloferula helveola TaxID=490095 RepID=A0ABN6H843_9BACT|nr:hypothetical protein HAHE_37540 [Haloferula helveola]
MLLEQLEIMIPFLFECVSRSQLILLVTAHYEMNQLIFTEASKFPIEHVEALIDELNAQWLSSLSVNEKSIVEQLPASDLEIEAFRICRSLAMVEDVQLERGSFYLGANNLAQRLGETKYIAAMILEAFCELDILKVVKKGDSFQKERPLEKGRRRKATIYRWLPRLPEPSEKPGTRGADRNQT